MFFRQIVRVGLRRLPVVLSRQVRQIRPQRLGHLPQALPSPILRRTPLLPRIHQIDRRFFSQGCPQQANHSFSNPFRQFFSWASEGAISFTLFSSALYAFYHMLSEFYAPRETAIIAQSIVAEDCSDRVYGATEQHHGTLSSEVLEYHDKTFLKKGAANREKLLREFIIGDALHEMYPDSQPLTLLFHKQVNGSSAQYFTLSEIKPKSQDFADFIKSNTWRERLKEKPLVGFERALAMVGLMAGQQDCKFANLVIIEKDNHFEAAAIDFELSGERFFSINQRKATSNFNRLTRMIRDLHGTGDEQFGQGQHFELTGDPRGQEFIDYAQSHAMSVDELDSFYQKVAVHDFETTLEKLEVLSTETDLVNAKDISAWRAEFSKWKACAKSYCDTHQPSSSVTLV